MYSRDEVKIKIQKLLRLASDNGASQGEVESAIEKAQALIAKYAIEENEIHNAENASVKVRDIVLNITRPDVWYRKLICQIISDNFKCYTYYMKPYKKYSYPASLHLVGTEQDVDICTQVIEFVLRESMKHCRKFMKENGYSTNAYVNSWMTGFLSGLRKRLQDQIHARGWQLVVSIPREVLDYTGTLGIKHTDLRTPPKSNDPTVVLDGYKKGLSSDLYNPINNNAE